MRFPCSGLLKEIKLELTSVQNGEDWIFVCTTAQI